jgi:hypothetical protein
MHQLLGTLLWLLAPLNLSAYKENLQPFATIDFFQDREYHYDNLLERLNLLTLHNRHRHFDALFLINVFIGTKCCPSVFETVGIRVHTLNIGNFTLFTRCSSTTLPSARWVSAANAVCKPTDIFNNSYLSLNNRNWSMFLCACVLSCVVSLLLLFVFVLTL